MPTPSKGYRLANGSRVPGTTTIIGKFKEAGGLMHWAWQCGVDGLDYRQVRDEAASAGTLAHDLVERWIRRESLSLVADPDETMAKAQQAFRTFLEWAEQTKLQPKETEVQLVSEKHRFGGTLDAMLVNDKLALGDWKTSNGVYGDYLFQLAAYAILWEENFPDQPIDGGYHLIRFSKEHADFTHHFWSDLESCKRGFLLMRELYDIKAEADKRCK